MKDLKPGPCMVGWWKRQLVYRFDITTYKRFNAVPNQGSGVKRQEFEVRWFGDENSGIAKSAVHLNPEA